jgi:hypothetical protein
MNCHAVNILIHACDELMAAAGQLRSISQKESPEWHTTQAARLINRVLDTRCQLMKLRGPLKIEPLPPKTTQKL